MASTGLDCCSKFAKYFLFIFNVVFWIVGVAILAVGIWVLADNDALQLMQVATVDSSDDLVKGAAITFIIIGVIVFITGFLGCCGALKESQCMLLMYAFIVGFILILQIAAGIMGAVFKDEIQDELTSSMNKTVQLRYGKAGEEGNTEAWDFMQAEFECCGAVDGPSEWATSYWKANVALSNQTVPKTCCVLKDRSDYKNPEPVDEKLCYYYSINTNDTKADDYVNTEGCEPQLEDWVVDHAAILIGVAFGLIFVQILCIINACCIRRQVMNSGTFA